MENIGIPYEQLQKMKYILFCIFKYLHMNSNEFIPNIKMPTHQAMRKWLRQQLLDADEESRTWRLRAIQVWLHRKFSDKMPVFFVECCWILFLIQQTQLLMNIQHMRLLESSTNG